MADGWLARASGAFSSELVIPLFPARPAPAEPSAVRASARAVRPVGPPAPRHSREWPGTVSVEQELAPTRPHLERGRASWCYGTPGIARALHLAGVALGEDEWVHGAAEAMRLVFAHPDGLRELGDPGVRRRPRRAGADHRTYGRRAGRSVAVRAGGRDSRSGRAPASTPARPSAIPTAPVPPHRPEPLDAPTFLEGAVVALALLGRSTPPAGAAHGSLPWDAALLVV